MAATSKENIILQGYAKTGVTDPREQNIVTQGYGPIFLVSSAMTKGDIVYVRGTEPAAHGSRSSVGAIGHTKLCEDR